MDCFASLAKTRRYGDPFATCGVGGSISLGDYPAATFGAGETLTASLP